MPPAPATHYPHWEMPEKFRVGEERHWHVCDKANPDALIYQVWPEFAERILALDERLPGIWSFTESRLEKWVKPTQMLKQLRAIFWSHVYRNRQLAVPIRERTILIGFLDQSTFLSMIAHDANLAYLLRPPSRVEALMESLLHQGLRKLMAVIDEPMEKKRGREKRDHISNILMVMREVERRLCRDQTRLLAERMKEREKLFIAMGREGAMLNEKPLTSLPPEEEEEFDYTDFDLEGEDDEGAGRSDSGNEAQSGAEKRVDPPSGQTCE